MRYYVKNNNLYATLIPFCDPCYEEVSPDEYNKRVTQAEAGREKGVEYDFVSGSGVEIW